MELSWYIGRLKKMPLGEIPYRVGQASKKAIDRYIRPCKLLPRIELQWPQSIFESGRGMCSMQGLDMANLIKEADSLVNNTFTIFGKRCALSDPIDFHIDFQSNKSWPITYWGDISYRPPKSLIDIRLAWELNRLHYWPQLAFAYNLTGSEKYLYALCKQIERWKETNPYPFGINWISGLELGIRIINLFYSLKLLPKKAQQVLPQQSIRRFIYLHGRHLYRYPSKFSSCANHTLGEALGLYIAGLLLPCCNVAEGWKFYGKRILEEEVLRQIYPDGSSFEHSIPYLLFVVEHFLIYYLVSKEYGEAISQDIISRLQSAFNFLVAIADVGGNIPRIGDDDDGLLIKLWADKQRNFLSLLTTGAILFHEPRWIHPAASFNIKTILLIGNGAQEKYAQLVDQPCWRKKPTYFANAGLAVIPHVKNGQEILFVGNSGPLGLAPLSGHGHADVLSFWLSINGQPFFIDPGTYLYNCGGEWRQFFRSTAAHNTVQIDEKDQSEQVTNFMFQDFYKIRNILWEQKGNRIYWSAEHSGYSRLPDPVIHKREVIYDKGHYSFTIADTLRCCKEHKVTQCFHLHPDVNVTHQGDCTYLFSLKTSTVLLEADNKMQANLFHGSLSPLMGWHSPSFNSLEKTNSLVFSAKISGTSSFTTKITII